MGPKKPSSRLDVCLCLAPAAVWLTGNPAVPLAHTLSLPALPQSLPALLACSACPALLGLQANRRIEWSEVPFWQQRFCPDHAYDGTPRCTSCDRLRPHEEAGSWAELEDGRSICLPCLGTITTDTRDAQPLWQKVLRCGMHTDEPGGAQAQEQAQEQVQRTGRCHPQLPTTFLLPTPGWLTTSHHTRAHPWRHTTRPHATRLSSYLPACLPAASMPRSACLCPWCRP
jgi:hypothetical protein